MTVRGAALSLAYVPGRAIDVGPALDVTAHRIRDTLSPAVQILVLVALVLWWKKPRRPEMFPFRAAKGAAASDRPEGDGHEGRRAGQGRDETAARDRGTARPA